MILVSSRRILFISLSGADRVSFPVCSVKVQTFFDPCKSVWRDVVPRESQKIALSCCIT